MIVKKAAPLFNQKGYFGAAISDIMQETGLKKGGIYNHFESKESLALEAFDYAVIQVELWFSNKVKDKKTADEKLFTIINAFKEYAESPPVPGGCPLLNTAVESDDAHPTLRKRTQLAMDRSRQRLVDIVNQGMEEGTLRSDVDPDTVATILTSAFEGALMMCRLYGDTKYMNQIRDHLMSYLKAHVISQ